MVARALILMTPELTRLRGRVQKARPVVFHNFGQFLDVFRSIFRADFGVRFSRA